MKNFNIIDQRYYQSNQIILIEKFMINSFIHNNSLDDPRYWHLSVNASKIAYHNVQKVENLMKLRDTIDQAIYKELSGH